MPKIYKILLNLILVYVGMYSIITVLADVMQQRLREKYPEDGVFERPKWVSNYFVILNTTFQIGNFIARSSVRYIKLSHRNAYSICMTFNFLFLFWNTYTMTIESVWFNSAFFLWVGLVGGTAYVNLLH